MPRNKSWVACLIAIFLLVMNFGSALAHESIMVGDYEIELGWLDEPPIAGQENAIVVNVTETSSGEARPVEDVSSLTVTISYGGQSRVLALEPLGEDTPGQFMAPLLPTLPGQYTVIFGGRLGDTEVNEIEAEPEEVEPADKREFPVLSSPEQGVSNWLVYLSLLIGLAALGVGTMALRKKP